MVKNSPISVGIVGAGLSGCLAAYFLSQNEQVGSITLIDPSFELRNEKIWSYWTQETSPFPQLVHHRWNKLTVRFETNEFTETLQNLRYECIREQDFLSFMFQNLKEKVEFVRAHVGSVHETKQNVYVSSESTSHSFDFVFQSVKPQLNPNYSSIKTRLSQHFLGWEIECDNEAFHANAATFMDFNVSQEYGPAFMYVLPFSGHKALFEFTVFSPEVLQSEQPYEAQIEKYLSRFQPNVGDFHLLRKEKGNIPMMDLAPHFHSGRLQHIGTAGGFIQPSSGYSFANNVAYLRDLKNWRPGLAPFQKRPERFFIYNKTILSVLATAPRQAPEVYRQLFATVGIESMLNFLTERPNPLLELSVMWHSPKKLFLPAMKKSLIS